MGGRISSARAVWKVKSRHRAEPPSAEDHGTVRCGAGFSNKPRGHPHRYSSRRMFALSSPSPSTLAWSSVPTRAETVDFPPLTPTKLFTYVPFISFLASFCFFSKKHTQPFWILSPPSFFHSPLPLSPPPWPWFETRSTTMTSHRHPLS